MLVDQLVDPRLLVGEPLPAPFDERPQPASAQGRIGDRRDVVTAAATSSTVGATCRLPRRRLDRRRPSHRSRVVLVPSSPRLDCVGPLDGPGATPCGPCSPRSTPIVRHGTTGSWSRTSTRGPRSRTSPSVRSWWRSSYDRLLPRAFVALGALVAVEGVGSCLYHGGSGTLGSVPPRRALGRDARVRRRLARQPTAPADRRHHRCPRRCGGRTGRRWNRSCSRGHQCAGGGRGGGRRRHRGRRPPPRLATSVECRPHRAGRPVCGELVGRDGDSPLCDEQSLLQPHGLWHVLSALLLLGWFDNAMTATSPERAPRLWRRRH